MELRTLVYAQHNTSRAHRNNDVCSAVNVRMNQRGTFSARHFQLYAYVDYVVIRFPRWCIVKEKKRKEKRNGCIADVRMECAVLGHFFLSREQKKSHPDAHEGRIMHTMHLPNILSEFHLFQDGVSYRKQWAAKGHKMYLKKTRLAIDKSLELLRSAWPQQGAGQWLLLGSYDFRLSGLPFTNDKIWVYTTKT